MVQAINSVENKIYYNQKKFKTEDKNKFENHNSELVGYEVAKALLAKNNISFKNLSQPIEITHLYNKKTEGKDHLDLDNIHVYEFKDTNLKAIINKTNDCRNSQILISIESEPKNYDILKQALVNQIIFSEFKQNNLEQYYNLDFHSSNQIISTDSENILNYSDISLFNKILTDTNIDNTKLENAKKELIKYINSSEYKEKTLLGNSLHKNDLINEEDFSKKLNNIKLKEIKEYYDNYLNNSKMEVVLTINEKDFEKHNILNKLNNNIKMQFQKDINQNDIILNNETRYVYTNGDNSKTNLYYIVDDSNLKNDIILKIISKLENKYSTIRQNQMDSYIKFKVEMLAPNITEKEKLGFAKILKQREDINFISNAGKNVINSVETPLMLQSNVKEFYKDYYKIPLGENYNNDEDLINKLQQDFKNFADKDLKADIENIKHNYKIYLKHNLLENDIDSIRNLNLALLGTDIFQAYETIDNISENDVKNYIQKYFIEQPPIVETVGNNNNISFKNLSQPTEITHLYNKKTEGKDHLDLDNIHVYEFKDTNLKIFTDENDKKPISTPLEVNLFIGNSLKNQSPIKEALLKELIKIKLRTLPNFELNEINNGKFEITFFTNDYSDFIKTNKIISKIDFNEKEFIQAKNNVIKILESEENIEYIKNLNKINNQTELKSIPDTIKEIQEISDKDLINYQKEQNPQQEVIYYITLGKHHSKKDLMNYVNKEIQTKYKKLSNNVKQASFYNTSPQILSSKDNKTSMFKIIYPCEENNLKDYFINEFTNMLLIFLLPPYHTENSKNEFKKNPINVKNSSFSQTYHNLELHIPHVDFINIEPDDAISIEKSVLKIINSTDYTITFNDLKKQYKEFIAENLLENYSEENNKILSQYSYDIFQLYEIIDSIKIDDIKNHIDKYLIEQEPIVIMNNGV